MLGDNSNSVFENVKSMKFKSFTLRLFVASITCLGAFAAIGAMRPVSRLETITGIPVVTDEDEEESSVKKDPNDVAKDWEKPDLTLFISCLLYTSPSPRDQRGSRMPSSA